MTDPTLIEQVALREACEAWEAFSTARQKMNAAIPDPIEATPAERQLYNERYKADHEAERAFRGAACGLFIDGHAQTILATLQGSAALPSEAIEFKSGLGWITTPSGNTVSQYMLDRKIEECADAGTIRLLQAFKETIGHFCGDAA